MRVTINGKEVIIPSSLSEITLQQRIDYQNNVGEELEKMLKSIFEMPEDFERELEMIEFQNEKMFRTFAFFAGVSTQSLKESEFVNDIANIYYSTLHTLFEDEDKIDLQQEFAWNNEMWHLHTPELKNGDKMKFGELIDAKQIIKDMIELGANRWECILPLCAIYLRKKGEQYEESFLYEGSERRELMKSLPLDIAMQVGFFLLFSLNTYQNTLQYSGQVKSGNPVKILNDILKSGVGSTSLLQ